MSNDVNEGVILAVQICIVSVIIGALMVVVSLGMNIKRQGFDVVNKVGMAMSEGEIDAIADYTTMNDIPVATAYMSLLKNEKTIRNVTVNGTLYVRTSNPYNYDSIINTLRPMFNQRCTIRYTEFKFSGIYDIEVVTIP